MRIKHHDLEENSGDSVTHGLCYAAKLPYLGTPPNPRLVYRAFAMRGQCAARH